MVQMPSTGGCKNSFLPQKTPKSVFDKYSINAGKSNPSFSVFCRTPTNAQNLLTVPSFAEIGTRVALWLTFATWCVIKGIFEITLLALPGGNREADLQGKKSLVFLRLHPANMAKPFYHQVRHGDDSDSNILNTL